MLRVDYVECSKCGGRMSNPRYCPGARVCRAQEYGEHLHRICMTCGYDRTEPTREQRAASPKGRPE